MNSFLGLAFVWHQNRVLPWLHGHVAYLQDFEDRFDIMPRRSSHVYHNSEPKLFNIVTENTQTSQVTSHTTCTKKSCVWKHSVSSENKNITNLYVYNTDSQCQILQGFPHMSHWKAGFYLSAAAFLNLPPFYKKNTPHFVVNMSC